jgi:hypothetical protein
MAVDDGKWQDVAVLQHGEKEIREEIQEAPIQKEICAET